MKKIIETLTLFTEKSYLHAARVAGSRGFFVAILAFIFVQSLWYVLTFDLTLFDESQHFNFIRFYSDRIVPFVTDQPPEWDFLGDTTRNSNYLFYYLMSFPYRFIELFTDSQYATVVALRLFLLAFVLAGAVTYRRLFLRLKASRAGANVAVLVLFLIPGIAPIAGAINYDNVIFLSTAAILLLAVRIEQARSLKSFDLILFFAIGAVSSLIKFSFMPIFVPVAAFLLYRIYKKYGISAISRFKDSFLSLNMRTRVFLAAAFFVPAGLFIERPVYNYVKWENVNPRCYDVISEERCLNNYTAERDITFLDARPDNFKRLAPSSFLFGLWLPGMIKTTSTVIYSASPVLLMEVTINVALFGAGGLILVNFRDFWRNKAMRYLFIATVSYVGALMLQNYSGYHRLGQPVAIAGRYLYPVMPLVVFMFVAAYMNLIGRRFKLLSIVLLLSLPVLLLQGAGVVSTMIKADAGLYQQSQDIRDFNEDLREVLRSVTPDGNPFRRI